MHLAHVPCAQHRTCTNQPCRNPLTATQACGYATSHDGALSEELLKQVDTALARTEVIMEQRFGDASEGHVDATTGRPPVPLLLSVRCVSAWV